MSAAEQASHRDDDIAQGLVSRPPAVTGYRLERMRLDDIAEVAIVERRSFSNPWPTSAYRRELQNLAQNHYLVLRADLAPDSPHPAAVRQAMPRRGLLPIGFGRRPSPPRRPDPIVGFAGMWNAFDEAHVTTIAVDEPWRGNSLGELLLAALFDEAARRGANWLTLEVRVSNEPAQALYRKWGFAIQGTRRRYYSDNNEDAHVMWSRAITDPGYRDDLARLRRMLLERLGVPVTGFPVDGPAPAAAAPTGKAPWDV